MNDLIIFVPIVAALSGVLLWLLLPRRKSTAPPKADSFDKWNEALAAPKHYRYFSQIRQALSATDRDYLLKNAPPHVAKQALLERRAVALGFLKGLHEDFSNLARLGRTIAALSPEISRQQETQRLILSLKFQALYGLVWLRLSTGDLPLQQLEDLTGLVGRLASRMDEAMNAIAAQSAGRITERLGA